MFFKEIFFFDLLNMVEFQRCSYGGSIFVSLTWTVTVSLIWHETFCFTKSRPYGHGWSLLSLVLICLQISILDMCSYVLILEWVEYYLQLLKAESQNSDLFCYELVAPNCIKCIVGGNLYVQLQEIQCQGYRGNCMHSEKLMNGFWTFWHFKWDVPAESLVHDKGK